jgi:CheY-like chemotaxis protein
MHDMGEPDNAQQTSSEVRRLVEARLAQVEGMATIGMLLEGSIHGINNPLASLLASLEQLCDRLRELIPTDEQLEAVRIAEEALAEGERVASAVRNLTSLLPTDTSGPIDINDVVQSVLFTLEKKLGGRVTIVRKLEPMQPLEGRESRVAQVLLSAASLCIDVALDQAPADVVRLQASLTQRHGRASVAFEATDLSVGAQGMESQEHTRRLQLLRGVVQQLGGTLELTPERVAIDLPFAAPVYDSEAEVSLKRRESAPPRGELRILVVDDEPSIQRALERGLRDVGFVQTVTSGRGAMELLEGGATFDVVLSDVVMPDGTGIELADWLARHRPRLKRRLILMTGMGEMHTDSHPDVMTVPKPFDLPALRELVCQVATRT